MAYIAACGFIRRMMEMTHLAWAALGKVFFIQNPFNGAFLITSQPPLGQLEYSKGHKGR